MLNYVLPKIGVLKHLFFAHVYKNALFCDFRQFYGLDFFETRNDKVRMCVLIEGLDRWESRYWAALSGRDPAPLTAHIAGDIWRALCGTTESHPMLMTVAEREEKTREHESYMAMERRTRARLKARRQLLEQNKTT